MNELENQVRVVAEARQAAKTSKEIVNESSEIWEEQNKVITAELFNANEYVKEEETLLQELTLKAYKETGNKAPAKGVGIREVTKLEYDGTTALGWALEHKIMLKLDVPTFEKYAKQNPVAFVTIIHELQATIATNLEEIK